MNNDRVQIMPKEAINEAKKIAAQKKLRDAIDYVNTRMISGSEFSRDRNTDPDILARIMLEEINTTRRPYFERGLILTTTPDNIIVQMNVLTRLIQEQRDDPRFDFRVIAILNQFMKERESKQSELDFKRYLNHGIIHPDEIDGYISFKVILENAEKL